MGPVPPDAVSFGSEAFAGSFDPEAFAGSLGSEAFVGAAPFEAGMPGGPQGATGMAGILLTVLQGPFFLVLPVAICTIGLPRRRLFWLRALFSVAVLLGMLMLAGELINANVPPGQTAGWRYMMAQLTEFAGFVLLAALLILFCYDCSFLSALFCSTAGYTMQNLATSLAGLSLSIAGYISPELATMTYMNTVNTAWMLIVYVIGYFTLVRRISRMGLEPTGKLSMVVVVMTAIFFNTFFDMAQRDLSAFGVPFLHVTIIELAHIGACLLTLFLEYELLYNRQLELDTAAMEQVIANQARQYQISRETMDAINLKVHDIKHQIRQLQDGSVEVDARALASLEDDIRIYDSRVRSENEALDTILTEKRLVCEAEDINLNCIADGHALDFMEPSDLYALFGNALDNAIEAVHGVSDPERRAIRVIVRRMGDMVSIHIENYFEGKRHFVDGLPTTTKEDASSHGYGTRSMRRTVEKYGGTITMGARGQLFQVNMMIPTEA